MLTSAAQRPALPVIPNNAGAWPTRSPITLYSVARGIPFTFDRAR